MTEPSVAKTNARPEGQLLEMVWPASRRAAPPAWQTPAGYEIRPYRPGDEAGFLELLFSVGWPEGLGETTAPTDPVLNKDGFLFAVHPASGAWAATLMLLEHEAPGQPRRGELSWLAVAPEHRRQGLGRTLMAAGVSLLLDRGFHDIFLVTESRLLNALRIYLDMGFVPRISGPASRGRWRRVCHRLAWPFTPEIWREET